MSSRCWTVRSDEVLEKLQEPGPHGYKDFEQLFGCEFRTRTQKARIHEAMQRLRSQGHKILCRRGLGWQLAKYCNTPMLTEREQEVVNAIAAGHTDRGAIARVIFASDPPQFLDANKENVSVVCTRLRDKGIIYSPKFGKYAIKE